MDETLFRQLVADYLLPMFSGTSLDNQSYISHTKHQPVSFADPCALWLKPTQNTKYRVKIIRSQPFDSKGTGRSAEVIAAKAFVHCVSRFDSITDKYVLVDVKHNFMRRVIARALGETHETLFLEIIDRLTAFSVEKYEGHAIRMSIGVDTKSVPVAVPGPLLVDLLKEPFAPVLANGVDTIVTCDGNGAVMEHQHLATPSESEMPMFAPSRFAPVASWAKDGKVAICLTRTGDIVVFKFGRLYAARRGSKWMVFSHSPVITQMSLPNIPDHRKAVYASCLDVSFAHTGGCIGVVRSDKVNRLKSVVENRDCVGSESVKGKYLATTIGQPFHLLPRPTRQDLLSMDGALILDSNCEVLAVGAIVSVPGGSIGGGRLAAAIKLRELGLGIKISQDGPITGFHMNSRMDGDRVRPKFTAG